MLKLSEVALYRKFDKSSANKMPRRSGLSSEVKPLQRMPKVGTMATGSLSYQGDRCNHNKSVDDVPHVFLCPDGLRAELFCWPIESAGMKMWSPCRLARRMGLRVVKT